MTSFPSYEAIEEILEECAVGIDLFGGFVRLEDLRHEVSSWFARITHNMDEGFTDMVSREICGRFPGITIRFVCGERAL